MKKILEISLMIGLTLTLTPAILTQDKIRKIQDIPLQKNSPITIVGRELGDRQFSGEDRVWGGRDWLKHLSFDVKNVTNKNIIYFEINVRVPKQKRMPATVVFRVEFGAQMPSDGDTPESASRRKVLRSGETTKARISDSEFSLWTRELERYGVNDVERVSLDVRMVEFDDGTIWRLGSEWKRDSNDKKRWVPINELKKPSKQIHPLPLWLASFVPLPTITNLCGNTLTLIPASSRIFLTPTTLPTAECGYDAGPREYDQSCAGCTHPDDEIGCDRRLDDGLLSSPPQTRISGS